MKRRLACKTLALTLGIAALAAPHPALAQDAWPSKPVKIVAPVAPGGGVDLVARTIADRLNKAFGQSFIVENQSGGGGVIASQNVTRAAPDGYTLMLGYVGTHGTNPAVRKVPYDAINGFTPIAMVGGTPNVLVVTPNLPVKSVPELVAYLKANPGKASYGSAGPGTLTHLAMEQFKENTKTFMVHAPYRGIGPAIMDVLGGQTQAMFPGLAAALPHIKGGKLKPLAVTGTSRHRLLPEVPTMEELGYKGFDGVQWYGIVGPAGMPQPIVAKLNTEINKQLAMPDLKEKLSGEALETMPMTPEQFGDYIKKDIAKWSELVKVRKLDIE
ncbi:tripartite tricarboxylate transporter substrate binding protein [Noviherbaspirillum sp. L7-7A]|uniref:Bug family tripartite tricarboxylate transporter substrate binding protein n=1 Tax=Noviherbaspirillum sp. L7-7A TaxID=2850560 RepID=UPI001C2BB9F9|nr:tripartite tricarboxylate transporter substrate binding protein [Noviherbaspirillum sp. L7-7A]MBV0882294.1 tripartite tricarboxylate transporter substrate binding protein [Noviherbaspirillum sp. L7-7A]